MSNEEIEQAIKKWDLNDGYYNYNTLFGKYATYIMICLFEGRKLKITRIKNKKCETKIFDANTGLTLHWYNIRRYYNENLEHGEDKILEFEII